MIAPPSICRVWFGEEPFTCTPLDSGGFSGSRVFVVTPAGTAGEAHRLVLKSFPGGATAERAGWIHALMRHLRAEGVTQVPGVIATPGGQTVVAGHDGLLWELVGLMPGVAVDRPTEEEASSGLETLAALHLAASRLPASVRRGASSGHLVRIEQARRLLEDPWARRLDRLGRAGAGSSSAKTTAEAERLAAAIAMRLDAAIGIFARVEGRRALELVAASRVASVRLQPVLRDVSGEHVLYEPSVVGLRDDGGVGRRPPPRRPSGIVDYHAAAIDTPATDIARLLGSWERPADRRQLPLDAAWREAIAAYDRVRPLDAGERRAIPFLYATAVVLGLDNWFRWTLEERRWFADAGRVVVRIDRLLANLEAAIAEMADAAAGRD